MNHRPLNFICTPADFIRQLNELYPPIAITPIPDFLRGHSVTNNKIVEADDELLKAFLGRDLS